MTATSLNARVIRDREWVEREYNREKYPIVLEAAKEAMSDGGKSLGRAVGQVILKERGAIRTCDQRDFVVDGRGMVLTTAFGSAGISGFITNSIIAACCGTTDAVIELGAGWGRNLFNAYLAGAGGEEMTYYSLEFAETARQTTDLLSGLETNLRMRSVAFDYHAPAYEAITPSDAPTVVISVHSVEQIPFLKEDVFLKLLERRPNLTGLHVEPIGWQLPEEEWGAAEPKSTEAYAEQHDYNRNLWATLEGLEQRDVLAITEVSPDIMGLNVRNPSSFIRWQSHG
jgi:hypothetical protein